MPFNGSGTFVRLYNWVTDRNANVKIQAVRMDGEMDGFATGLSNCIAKDGQTTISQNIPFNNKKITGLGDATADTDALNRQSADARYTRITDIDEYLSASNYAETDIASASTCDIGAITTPRVRITGTATITSFGTDTNTLRFVRFADALTLTHNATSLVLPGAANITTAAGDVAILASDASGYWRCLQYQRAALGPSSVVNSVNTRTGAVTLVSTDLTVAATERLVGRKTAGGGASEECTLSEVLDFIGSATRGDLLFRGASSWQRLAASTSGYALLAAGAGADPAWGAVLLPAGGQTLSGGFNATSYNAGTLAGSATYTPNPLNSNLHYAVNGGAHTLAPPASDCTIVLQYTNNASAGTITTSGYNKVSGITPSTANGDDFLALIMRVNGYSQLTWVALQ